MLGTAVESAREMVLKYVWMRCEEAWAEGQIEDAQELHRFYVAVEQMTDEDYEGTVSELPGEDR